VGSILGLVHVGYLGTMKRQKPQNISKDCREDVKIEDRNT